MRGKVGLEKGLVARVGHVEPEKEGVRRWWESSKRGSRDSGGRLRKHREDTSAARASDDERAEGRSSSREDIAEMQRVSARAVGRTSEQRERETVWRGEEGREKLPEQQPSGSADVSSGLPKRISWCWRSSSAMWLSITACAAA